MAWRRACLILQRKSRRCTAAIENSGVSSRRVNAAALNKIAPQIIQQNRMSSIPPTTAIAIHRVLRDSRSLTFFKVRSLSHQCAAAISPIGHDVLRAKFSLRVTEGNPPRNRYRQDA